MTRDVQFVQRSPSEWLLIDDRREPGDPRRQVGLVYLSRRHGAWFWSTRYVLDQVAHPTREAAAAALREFLP